MRERSLVAILDAIGDTAEAGSVTVGDIVEAVGRTSFAALLLVPALVAVSPLSGVPGVSMACGLTIAFVSAEMLMNFDRLRLPRALMRRSVSGARLGKALAAVRPAVAWLDRHTRNRLGFLFHRPIVYVPQLLCLVSGLAMPFLEVIPFSSSVVAAGVSMLALSLLTRDGLFFLLALLPYATLGYFGVRLLA
jgi:hypothetical protein